MHYRLAVAAADALRERALLCWRSAAPRPAAAHHMAANAAPPTALHPRAAAILDFW
jgi:hypothetical protein